MAEFFRSEKGVGYLRISYAELYAYSQTEPLVCDECLRGLSSSDDIVLIPYTNEAYCEECGKERLEAMRCFPEDDSIRERREDFYKNFYQIYVEQKG